eukprot:SAG11_NODE_5842_length_1450_cov_1.779423_1_plen_183_part_00
MLQTSSSPSPRLSPSSDFSYIPACGTLTDGRICGAAEALAKSKKTVTSLRKLDKMRQLELTERATLSATTALEPEELAHETGPTAEQAAEQAEWAEQAASAFKAQLYAAAAKLYTEALECGMPTHTLLSNRAAAYLQCAEPALALEDAEAAIQLRRGSARAVYRKARALLELSHLASMEALV